MRRIRHIIASGTTFFLLALPLKAEQVVIFAASSLKTVLDEVVEEHALNVSIAYGGSAAIARQIAQGAQAQIVILAHPEWMTWLEQHDALARESRCDLTANALVLAGAVDAPDLEIKTSQDLIKALGGARLAVGNFQSVPAGQYTAAYLEGQGWLTSLRPHLAETSNVRLALALIARADVPLGFVYASDVVAEPRVRARFIPDNGSYPAIRYPMALSKDAGAGAEQVAHVIARSEAIFTRKGFETLPSNDASRCK